LGAVLAVVALTATGGSIYGLTGARYVPAEWLEGSPFHSYFIPSLILLVVVGGSSLAACISVFRRSANARRMAQLAGLVLLVWIVTQVSIIGYVSWLQPAMFGAALLMLVLAKMMPRGE